jgi:hypothetical protein
VLCATLPLEDLGNQRSGPLYTTTVHGSVAAQNGNLIGKEIDRLLNGTSFRRCPQSFFPKFPLPFPFSLTPSQNLLLLATLEVHLHSHNHLQILLVYLHSSIHITDTMAARITPKMASLMGSTSAKVARPMVRSNLGAQRAFSGKL